jgi:lysophospholipid acyltransferase (LPLAT)-like uncharacterized protein
MFIRILNTFIYQSLHLINQTSQQIYSQFQTRHLDQSPFITHIIIDFLLIHLKILSFSLKLSFDATDIKPFQGKIHFILFFHPFHKVYLKALILLRI